MILECLDRGDGPVVVLLHGFPFDRSLWDEQVDALSGPYRVIVPDLRGHGTSAVVPGVATVEAMARVSRTRRNMAALRWMRAGRGACRMRTRVAAERGCGAAG